MKLLRKMPCGPHADRGLATPCLGVSVAARALILFSACSAVGCGFVHTNVVVATVFHHEERAWTRGYTAIVSQNEIAVSGALVTSSQNSSCARCNETHESCPSACSIRLPERFLIRQTEAGGEVSCIVLGRFGCVAVSRTESHPTAIGWLELAEIIQRYH